MMAVAWGSAVECGASPDSSSGQSAPSSIQRLIAAICSALRGASGGICRPACVPTSLRYTGLASLLTGNNPRAIRADAIGHRQAPAIEAQALQLLRRAMAGVTARAKDRLDIASEIDAGRRLGERDAAREAQPCGDGDDAHHHWRRDYTQARPGRDNVQ